MTNIVPLPQKQDLAKAERVAMAIAAVWGHTAEAWNGRGVVRLSQAKRDLFLDAAVKAIEACEAEG